MTRPEFTSVFEESEEDIQARVLANENLADWRKEPGDYIYDTVATQPPEILQLEINQDYILKNAFAQYAEGQYLDLKLYERGLARIAATPNKRRLVVNADAGVVIPKDYTASAVVLDTGGNPLEYTVDAAVTFTTAGDMDVLLTCTTAGVIGNIVMGSEFVLQPPIPGVRLITDQGTTVAGTDQETDEAAFARYDFAVKNPDTGGNKFDHVRWCKEVTGVGAAKCIPRWNGVGTVKDLIVGTDLRPASTEVVAATQLYIDPAAEGLGEGKAPIGAATTVISATGKVITISATVTLLTGYQRATVKAAFEAAVTAYLATLVFTNPQLSVGYNRIAALLTFTDGVSDFTGLTVNGGTVDVAVGPEEVAILGTVTI